MWKRLLVPLCTITLATGCVSLTRYNAAVQEARALEEQLEEQKRARQLAEERKNQLAQEAQELTALRGQLVAEVATLKSRQAEYTIERRQLEQRNAELLEINDKLAKNKSELDKLREELEKKSAEYESLAASLRNQLQKGEFEISELRGRMTIRLQEKLLFATGSAKVDKDGRATLLKLAEVLKGVQGKLIRVEGHTDDVPTDPKGPFPTNWELSQARALAVVRVLIDEAKLDPSRLSATGYGQYQPLVPNTSAANRSINRRIEIVLAPVLTADK